ncbi:MAG: hypothetical protein REI12_02495 [Pedobacter sp.]|nr:hypothetical protein [Pedobacter sp.]
MKALDDVGLGEVAAQQGIAFDLEYRVNTKADGSPVDASECPAVGGLTGGSSCRVAYSLADSDGMWIVAKGYRGMIKLTNIFIDTTTLEASWTVRTQGGTNKNPYLGTYSPIGKPAFQLSAGNWVTAGCAAASPASSCYSYLNKSSYTDFTTSLNVEKLTAEFDTSTSSRDGYLKNQVAGAPIALRLAGGVGLIPDPNNPPDVIVGPYGNTPAQIRLDGRLQIHGFGY